MKDKFLFKALRGTAYLPLSVLYLFSDVISFFVYYVVRYRRGVVRKNLFESFPDKDKKEIIKIEKNFYRYLGDQIVETLKLLHLSDDELKRRVKIVDYDIINSTLQEGKNAVLLLGHYGNWEWVQEISRYFISESFKASIYHPLSNKTWDKFFIEMRSRWGAHIVSMKQAPRFLLNKNNQPWVCGFIADAWTWNKKDENKINFLNHPTWFIPGPEEIGNKVGAEYFYLEMKRLKRGHYEIRFHKLQPNNSASSYPFTHDFWRMFEKTIQTSPAYWLWSHKRWK